MHPAALAPDLPLLQQLYDEGKYVTAWRQAQNYAPFDQWRDSAGCTFAARLLGNLDAPRLSHLLHNRAWRADRSDAMAAYFRASVISSRLGSLRALRFLEKLPDFPSATPAARASLLGLRFRHLAVYRDTTRVEKLWEEALAIAPEFPWIWIERAAALESMDEYDGALAAAQRSLELHPNYRPAVQTVAHLYSLTGRDAEAIALLESATQVVESPAIAGQLAALFVEHDRHEEALAQWKRYRELAVAIEPANLAWWHARMSDAHYELGQITEAGEHARLAKNGFHEQIAGRLLQPPAEARVVRLAVPFVRQHDMTCAPATLSALSRYWQVPVDHLELAREICYDGTQPFRERQWAEQNGFLAREFTVTWETAVALLDRGIPFALGTVETRSAHLQAVMGYDGVRGTLIIRDPYLKHPGEVIGPKWLESYAHSGPRGSLIVPKIEAARLEGLALPDAGLYDRYHATAAALHVHDRDRAAEALAALEADAPDHRITQEARRELAWYDSNQPQALAATEALLAQFPESNRLKWARYSMLEGLSRHAERRAMLAELARGENSEPLFWREFGADLQRDARQLPNARRWMLRALRYQPTDAETLHMMAGILWDERRLPEALALYRLAATSRAKLEHLQRSWFIAARHLRRETEVLAIMRERAEREAKRSSLPAQTLFSALTSLGREHEALAELERAIQARPDDGPLLCFAADAFARHGQSDRATALLAGAERRSPRLDWLRAAARIADYKPDPAEALRLYLLAAPEAPLDIGLHDTIARLYAETQGRGRALEYLQEQINRFPHHLGFRESFIRWARGQGAVGCEAPLRELIELAPENAWALRELALVLAELNRPGEALEWCDKAVALSPKDDSSHGIRAFILLRGGRRKEAADAAAAALRLSIDYTSGFETLIESAESFAEKQEALAFILEELKRQTVFGDGLLEYLRHAFRILEPETLVQNLRGAHEARPDLWHAWAALITQLCDMQRAAEALPLAQEAVERFPLSARLWSDLARVHREQRNFPAEVEALQRATELSPAWGVLSRLLSLALQRVERYDDAQIALEEAIAAAPLDGQNYVELARLLWRRGRSPRCVELVTQAIQLNPDVMDGWEALREFLPPGSDTAVALARSITEKRGGETAPWLRLAEVLPRESIDARLAALDRAAELDARNCDVYDARAWILVEAGRYDEALAACDPPAFGGHPPRELRARAAWIIARRGNIRGALDRFREIVKADPDYYWAWERIAECCNELGEHKGEREAAEKMARLNPRSAVPLGYLADAMMKLGQREEGMQVLRRAFALDPSYGYAGFTVFREQLQQRKFDDAAATLCQLQQHLPGPDSTAAALRLAVAKGEKATALGWLEQLLCIPERDSHALHGAAQALREAGFSVDLEKLIWGQRDNAGINPAAAAIWVRSFMERQSWGHCRKVAGLSPATPFGAAAIRELANMCGETKRADILRALLSKHRAWLAEDREGWGNVAYAHANCGRWKDAMQWFGNWRERAGLQPWMLSNIAATFQEVGKEDDAMEASRLALTLPRDHTSAGHITRLAVLEAIRGQIATAAERLPEIDYRSLTERQKAEWAMVRVLADLAAADPDRRKRAAENERIRFYGDHPIVHADRSLKRLLRRFEQTLADTAGVSRRRPIKTRSRAVTRDSGQGVGAGTIAWIIMMVLFALSRCATP